MRCITLTGKILTVLLEHIVANSHATVLPQIVAQVFIVPAIFAQATNKTVVY